MENYTFEDMWLDLKNGYQIYYTYVRNRYVLFRTAKNCYTQKLLSDDPKNPQPKMTMLTLKRVKEIFPHMEDIEYKVGILIAPVILVENWKELYSGLIKYLSENLSPKAKKEAFFEIIFMTYSYVHRAINTEAFPNAIDLYNKELMTGRGKGKYMYKEYARKEGEVFLREEMNKYFKDNEIMYVV